MAESILSYASLSRSPCWAGASLSWARPRPSLSRSRLNSSPPIIAGLNSSDISFAKSDHRSIGRRTRDPRWLGGAMMKSPTTCAPKKTSPGSRQTFMAEHCHFRARAKIGWEIDSIASVDRSFLKGDAIVSPPASSRAALVLSAVGVDWRG